MGLRGETSDTSGSVCLNLFNIESRLCLSLLYHSDQNSHAMHSSVIDFLPRTVLKKMGRLTQVWWFYEKDSTMFHLMPGVVSLDA